MGCEHGCSDTYIGNCDVPGCTHASVKSTEQVEREMIDTRERRRRARRSFFETYKQLVQAGKVTLGDFKAALDRVGVDHGTGAREVGWCPAYVKGRSTCRVVQCEGRDCPGPALAKKDEILAQRDAARARKALPDQALPDPPGEVWLQQQELPESPNPLAEIGLAPWSHYLSAKDAVRVRLIVSRNELSANVAKLFVAFVYMVRCPNPSTDLERILTVRAARVVMNADIAMVDHVTDLYVKEMAR